MCGRFAITNPRFNRIEAILGTTSPEVRPRYNISPSQTIPVILECAEGVHELVEMRWGLVPHWSKDLQYLQRPRRDPGLKVTPTPLGALSTSQNKQPKREFLLVAQSSKHLH